MPMPPLQKFHIFSHIVHFLEHHIFAVLVSIGAVLCLSYLLDTPIVHAPGVSANSSRPARTLTLLDDPRYEDEFEKRAAYITQHLDMLRKETRARSAYLVSYRYGSAGSAHSGGLPELKISRSVEVGQFESSGHILDYQHLSRTNWRRVNRNGLSTGGILPGPFPRSYGIELYNERGGAIAYLGIDFLPDDASHHGKEVQLLQSAVAPVTEALLGPSGHLK